MKKNKKEIKNDNYSFELKESLKGILGVAIYFGISILGPIIPYLFGFDYDNWNITVKQIYLIGLCIFEMLLFFLLYRKELINGFKDLGKNIKPYLKGNLKIWFAALAIMYISNIAIAIYRGDAVVANNEQTIRDTLKKAAIYVVFATSLYAPFVEELTFRHSFRKIFKNKYIFVIISGLVFGALHVLQPGVQLIDLLYLIPYCTPGFAFAIIYLRTNNPTATISLHFIHNTILITLQVILLSKGLL